MVLPNFKPEANSIVIRAGVYDIAGQVITIASDARIQIAPSPVVWIEDEPLKLSPVEPQGFNVGTRLSGPNAWDINALDSLVPGSLVLRNSLGGEILQQQKDFLLSAPHALLGIGPESRISPDDTVYATYAYGLLRIDSLYLDETSHVSYVVGIPHITTPLPPRIPEKSLRLANIFCPYQVSYIATEHIYPIIELAEIAQTATAVGRIPKTLHKLKLGERVVIVCWGDSVTAGGNASEKRYRYTDVFTVALQSQFPEAKIAVHNVSVGGSSSVNWLYPHEFPFSQPGRQSELTFDRVMSLKPDLVTIEFVNDVGLDQVLRDTSYRFIHQRLCDLGAEVILITPHFTHPKWMGIDMRGCDNRSYVRFLRDFAEKHQLGIADASTRWEHLWKEGIPYLTLLHNSVNHPDNRGHRIFAEELMKCFMDA